MPLSKYKEDSYDDYRKYSGTVLKAVTVPENSELQNYQPSQSEKRNRTVPVETMRMKNLDGMLSVGIDRKKDVTITLTSDSQIPLLRADRKSVNMDSSKRMRNITGRIYTNSHDEKVSAIVYKENLEKGPGRIIDKLKKALGALDNAVVEEVAPFFTVQEDKKRKRQLDSYLRDSIERQNKEEYEAVKAQSDILQKRIRLKEREEARLLQNLETMSGRMEARARQLDADYRRTYIAPEFIASDAQDAAGAEEGQNDENKDEKKANTYIED